SRKRLDFRLLDAAGETVEVGAAPPDADGLHSLAVRLGRHGDAIYAAIESMNGARFVHDQLELAGWRAEIADAVKVKGLATVACRVVGRGPVRAEEVRVGRVRGLRAAGTLAASDQDRTLRSHRRLRWTN